jgi:hypothetical protein
MTIPRRAGQVSGRFPSAKAENGIPLDREATVCLDCLTKQLGRFVARAAGRLKSQGVGRRIDPAGRPLGHVLCEANAASGSFDGATRGLLLTQFGAGRRAGEATLV